MKVTNSAWDTNVVACSGKYLSVNWNASGGGAFAILPLPTPFGSLPHNLPYKLPDTLPLARGHTATVLDTDWSPHDDALVASGGEDGNVILWQVDDSTFDGWGAEGWVPKDFDPVLRIDASARKIGQVLFHPTAKNVVASASGDYTVKLWDLAAPESEKVALKGHGDAIQSLAFNPTGTLLATTCRDRKIRLFDPRTSGEAIRVTDGHSGIKGARVIWMGEHDKIATTGFSKMSDRQVCIWETGGLGNLKTMSLDQSAGVIMPFWSDNNILFLGMYCQYAFYKAHVDLIGHMQLARVMATSGTTNMKMTPFSHFPNTNLPTPSVECVSSLAGPLASLIAKLLVPTKFAEALLSPLLSSCLVK